MPAVASTYRLQLHAGFGFTRVEELLPYFASLGVTHLYLSPIWRARPGSSHGYDICEAGEINPELGGEEGFLRLSEMAKRFGLGLVLDFVSNHMCADPLRNPAWRDTLANGPSSQYAKYFDIDWEPVKDELRNKVLLPILGRQYGEVLEAGELRVEFANGEFALRYWEHNLPLNPRQSRLILRHRLEELRQELAGEEEALLEFESILFQLDHLPSYTEVDDAARAERQREIGIAFQRLQRLVEGTPVVAGHIERCIQDFNGKAGKASSFDLLHELLELQAYRLSYWRTAMHEINYRRFFDINELAGLRVEDDSVFDATHRKAFELLRSKRADGLRLDHIDGLYDPAMYLQRMRRELAEEAPGAYIVVEKILSEKEPMSPTWPVDGTTGYEFLNHLNRLYVLPEGMSEVRRIYARFARRHMAFAEVVNASKRQIIATSMASELNVLAHALNRISEKERRRRDFTLDSLQEALREVAACFGVYRTYISEGIVSEADRSAVEAAIREAIARNPAMESSIFHFIGECLCPRLEDVGGNEESFARRLRFAMKFQQYSGPVQAKGIEDTAFYRYCPLVSLNEVGGEPSHLGAPLREFHADNARRRASHPRSMIATATHDTKRGEDARARINALAELSKEWGKLLPQWSRSLGSAKSDLGTQQAPDRNDEYLFFQNLLAIWPADAQEADSELVQRMQQYMSKAVKEAKTHSSWVNPSNDYDAAVARYVEVGLLGKTSGRFLESFVPFARKVARIGAWNSLSQLTLKLASPGVTDFYQGCERWDLSLVDPDNRRPVDFEARKKWLADWDGNVDVEDPEAAKAGLTAMGLRFRREKRDLVVQGDYVELQCIGAMAGNGVAFARVWEGEALVALGMRWFSQLVPEDGSYREAAASWGESGVLPPEALRGRRYRNLITGELGEAGEVLRYSVIAGRFPGALLHFAG